MQTLDGSKHTTNTLTSCTLRSPNAESIASFYASTFPRRSETTAPSQRDLSEPPPPRAVHTENEAATSVDSNVVLGFPELSEPFGFGPFRGVR